MSKILRHENDMETSVSHPHNNEPLISVAFRTHPRCGRSASYAFPAASSAHAPFFGPSPTSQRHHGHVVEGCKHRQPRRGACGSRCRPFDGVRCEGVSSSAEFQVPLWVAKRSAV